MINTNKITFITSVAEAKNLPDTDRPQVVFAGKSNVGKSSVLNSLARQNNLARVGKTPGKTIFANFFDADGKLLWVDLPGYGYAKVSFEEKKRWARLMEGYFSEAKHLVLGILIVDARHEPTEQDVDMLNYFRSVNLPTAILANKCDKLNKTEAAAAPGRIAAALKVPEDTILLYSAEKNIGRDDLFALLCDLAEGKDNQ